MDYYEKLYFVEKKHSYKTGQLSFFSKYPQSTYFEYDNDPSSGFKVLHFGLLDPVSGYTFTPENIYSFKEQLISRNLLTNGVCTTPIIFEYIKTGIYRVHIYDDVVDILNKIPIANNELVSLSDSFSGYVLRNINDESYYIYFGLVCQYYVSASGKGSIKKKHLVLKIDSIRDDDTIVVKKFSYMDFNKGSKTEYLKIKSVTENDLSVENHVKFIFAKDFYYSNKVLVNIEDYIFKDVFDIDAFQNDNGSLVLSSTIRALFSIDDILSTKNTVKLEYTEVGETPLIWSFSLQYDSYDIKEQVFYNSTISSYLSDESGQADFTKNNYALEYKGEKYLITARRLDEVDCYSPHFRKFIAVFGIHNFYLHLYKMNESTVTNNNNYYLDKAADLNMDFTVPLKLFKVEYVLNGKIRKNIFNPVSYSKCSEFLVADAKTFGILKEHSYVHCQLPTP